MSPDYANNKQSSWYSHHEVVQFVDAALDEGHIAPLELQQYIRLTPASVDNRDVALAPGQPPREPSRADRIEFVCVRHADQEGRGDLWNGRLEDFPGNDLAELLLTSSRPPDQARVCDPSASFDSDVRREHQQCKGRSRPLREHCRAGEDY